MKWKMVALLVLASLVPAATFAQQLTADQILSRVSQTYRGLRSFRFVERRDGHPPSVHNEETYDVVGRNLPEPFGKSYTAPGGYETDLAESTPGKLRLDLGHGGRFLLVSNGQTTWEYLAVFNEYVQFAAAPLLENMWRVPPYFGSDDLRRYGELSHQTGSSKLRGEETLDVGGKQVPCYVVSLPSPAGSRTLWVDQDRFLVVRDEWVSPPGSGSEVLNPGESVFVDWGVWSSQLEEASIGPISSDVFEFVPPKGARLLDSFSSPVGLVERGEEALAYRLVGVDVAHRVEGKKAADFTARDLSGGDVRLGDLLGKTVVLDFWASWCKPCQKDLAEVQKLHDELASKSVVFLGIDDEDGETVKSFVKKAGYTFPVLLDPDQRVHQLYGVRWAPTVVVINRKGKIAARYVGAGGDAGLRKALAAAGLDETTK